MRKNDKIILGVAVAVAVGMAGFPPWRMLLNGQTVDMGYALIGSPPTPVSAIDIVRLLVQWVIVAGAAILVSLLDSMKLLPWLERAAGAFRDDIGVVDSVYLRIKTRITIRTVLWILLITFLLTQIYWYKVAGSLSLVTPVEEKLHSLAAARNFQQYGFASTFLLPDMVSSRHAADHPVVYTHMPSLDSLVPAVIFKLGGNLAVLKFFYVGVSLLGLAYMYAVISRVFTPAIGIASLFFQVFDFHHFFVWSDHYVHSWTWLLMLGPVYHVLARNKTTDRRRRKFHDLMVLLLGIIAAQVSYVFLVVQAAMLGFLWLFGLVSIRARGVVVYAAVLAGVVALHLVQNILVLSPTIAFQELYLTLQNRILGVPTAGDLSKQFQAWNIVLWGASGFDRSALLTGLKAMVESQFAYFNNRFGFVLLVYVGYAMLEDTPARRAIWFRFLKVVLAVQLATVLWYFLFPAHSAGYMLQDLAIVGSVLCGFVAGSLWELSNRFKGFAVIFALIVAAYTVPAVVQFRSELHVASVLSRERPAESFDMLTDYKDLSIWTNMTSVFVGHVVNTPVAGRCTLAAVQKRDLTLCTNVLINSRSEFSWRRMAHPDLFVFSRAYLSGNAPGHTQAAIDALDDYLKGTYQLIRDEHGILVFDLRRPLP